MFRCANCGVTFGSTARRRVDFPACPSCPMGVLSAATGPEHDPQLEAFRHFVFVTLAFVVAVLALGGFADAVGLIP